jgi:hypothetical protein
MMVRKDRYKVTRHVRELSETTLLYVATMSRSGTSQRRSLDDEAQSIYLEAGSSAALVIALSYQKRFHVSSPQQAIIFVVVFLLSLEEAQTPFLELVCCSAQRTPRW